jgi:uncharacterized protein (TIGR04222 family)
MNPFNLPGPTFLLVYVVYLVGTLILAKKLQETFRQPGDKPSKAALTLDPYETAYLAGREESAVNAAIASLVHREALALDMKERKLSVWNDLPRNAHPFEQFVYNSVDPKSGQRIKEVRSNALSGMARVLGRPKALGLVLSDEQAWTARFVPALLIVSAPAFGIIKIIIGITRNRPVGFLIILCIISAFLANRFFVASIHRTKRGDQALEQIYEQNAALRHMADTQKVSDLAPYDLALAVGLFGPGILSHSLHSDLGTALLPPPSSSGSFSSGSSSCSSSSCGGSSCGGGCGGGGCGGCGS